MVSTRALFTSAAVLWAALLAPNATATEALRQHPANPRCFLFRGRPAALVGSTEHYGAVLNPDFDWPRYLDTLAVDGLDLVRIFSGAYFEKSGDFGIRDNTLAPAPGRALVPWARSATAGARGGGNTWDLDRWDPAYFERLHRFVEEASRRGIVVEVVFFSANYAGWGLSPLHADNNVNGLPVLDKRKVHTFDNGPLLGRQEALVRRIVAELAPFDNVYYEVQNEPYADLPETVDTTNPYLLSAEVAKDWLFWKNRVDLASRESLAWQERIAEVAVEEDVKRGSRHLVGQDVGNFRYPLRDVDERVAIVNFHYAWPEAATLNRDLGRVVGFNETGFAGAEDATYRRQAWEFLLAGGGLYCHLDYSFAVGHEDGTARNEAPGGGSPALRKQLRVLKDFLNGLDLAALAPDPLVVRAAPGAFTQALSAPGRQYAIYVRGEGRSRLTLELPAGRYREEWVDTKDGRIVKTEAWDHAGGRRSAESMPYVADVAPRLRAETR
jgi:hypothetical protein